MENAVKKVIEKSGKKQKEVSEITGIKQSTLSTQMNKNIDGTIEKSVRIAKKIKLKCYSFVFDGYQINVKRL